MNLVFTNGFGKPIHRGSPYDAIKKIGKKIGVTEMNIHGLRHTYATLSMQEGVDIKTLQDNLGHATAAFTLNVYTHVTDDMKEKSAERLGNFFDEVNPE